MKKTIFAFILGLCMLSTAFAADFNGVYKDPRQSNSYLSLHQNGDSIIATLYNTVPIVPAYSIYYNSVAGTYYPARADVWDLFFGTVSSNFGTFSGEFNYGACYLNGYLNLNVDASITFTVSSIYTTDSGYAQGVQCGRFSLGTFLMPRVF